MKIAILSLVLHENYGGILQSYALQTVLERMGHTVEVLNRPPAYPSTNWKEVPKRIVKKMLGRDEVVFKETRYQHEAATLNKAVWDFRKKYIHERIINDFSEIKETDYDCIVVGSDQVWRPKYFKSQWGCGIENAYLSFTKGWNIKRIAYAASFGVDEWEYTDEETRLCAEAAKMFDVISVRELSGVNLIKTHLECEATQVLDPTMLLSQEDYLKLLEADSTSKSKGVLNYVLNPSKEKRILIIKIAGEYNLPSFSVNNSMVKKTSAIEHRVLPSVETWLSGFRDSKLVVTDSFHACVFSLIFKKDFYAILNNQRGSERFYSLFKIVGKQSDYPPQIENNKLSVYFIKNTDIKEPKCFITSFSVLNIV